MGRPKGSPNKVKKLKAIKCGKYTKEAIEMVLACIADGTSLDELHRRNSNIYPSSSEVGHMIEEDEVFALRVETSRKVLANRLVELLHDIRSHPPNREQYINNVDGKFDKVAFKIDYEIWTKTLKSIHDEIHQLNGIYNNKYIKQTKSEVTNTEVQQVLIMNYKDYIPNNIIDVEGKSVSVIPNEDKH